MIFLLLAAIVAEPPPPPPPLVVLKIYPKLIPPQEGEVIVRVVPDVDTKWIA